MYHGCAANYTHFICWARYWQACWNSVSFYTFRDPRESRRLSRIPLSPPLFIQVGVVPLSRPWEVGRYVIRTERHGLESSTLRGLTGVASDSIGISQCQ